VLFVRTKGFLFHVSLVRQPRARVFWQKRKHFSTNPQWREFPAQFKKTVKTRPFRTEIPNQYA